MSLAKDEQEDLPSPKAVLENIGAKVVDIIPIHFISTELNKY
jgi:hypothetical protein